MPGAGFVRPAARGRARPLPCRTRIAQSSVTPGRFRTRAAYFGFAPSAKKTETAITSPVAGKIARVNVAVGDAGQAAG